MSRSVILPRRMQNGIFHYAVPVVAEDTYLIPPECADSFPTLSIGFNKLDLLLVWYMDYPVCGFKALMERKFSRSESREILSTSIQASEG